MAGSESRYDAVLVGAGIMSATLATLLNELDPNIRLLVIERLEEPGLESSAAINNAGTGHAANCELNYTPLNNQGSFEIKKALAINFAFEQSLELWASLVHQEKLIPNEFIKSLPHISFVWGEENCTYLKARYREMRKFPAFSSMEWSADFKELLDWMPLVMEGRSQSVSVAATRVHRGTDVNFGSLTKAYFKLLSKRGNFELALNTEVVDLFRGDHGKWIIDLVNNEGSKQVEGEFVFLGAGGGALPLLQKSGVPEAKGYGGFPVSGHWLVCSDQSLSKRHHAKVYGKAKIGAPPMSVPHLDSRWIDGKRSLLFGPYAGFSSKFLKNGSKLDLIRSVNHANFSSMLDVGKNNLDLVGYLVAQLTQSNEDRLKALVEFFPKAHGKDWHLSVAGQRVQIIKSTKHGGVLQMGTEVVASADGSLAALLGASPGASTAVHIMLELLKRCWSERFNTFEWQDRLKKLLPSFGHDPMQQSESLVNIRRRNNVLLNLE